MKNNMKKILSLIVIIYIAMFGANIAKAQDVSETPVYEPTYYGGQGAFFANGTPITIKQQEQNTVIEWNGGSQIVSSTVYVYGGGREDTDFESSSITMESGTVGYIYGGGVSTIENQPAKVTYVSIKIDGGTVSKEVFGGGRIYSEVDSTNITINNGDIKSIYGAGEARSLIDGMVYSAGTEDDVINSKNRVNKVDFVINDGIFFSPTLRYGAVFGGGRGYGYTGKVNLTVNGGNLAETYITAGGDSDYVGDAEVLINGGNIQTFQSMYQGTVDKIKFSMFKGNITHLYLGEVIAPTASKGKLNSSYFLILGENIQTLHSGSNKGQELDVDNDTYVAIYFKGKVKDNQAIGNVIVITYDIKINEENVQLHLNDEEKLTVTISTNPPGYEFVLDSEVIDWYSDVPAVVEVVSDGTISAVDIGQTIITAKLIDVSDSTTVTVVQDAVPDSNDTIVLVISISLILLLIVFLALICCRKCKPCKK